MAVLVPPSQCLSGIFNRHSSIVIDLVSSNQIEGGIFLHNDVPVQTQKHHLLTLQGGEVVT
jgi:hypothetical protein